MNFIKVVLVFVATISLAGCGDNPKSDKTFDKGFDRKHLSELKAGIWVDPRGCDHWIIDDGVEGYLSARLDKYGKPVCSGVAEPDTATGEYKSGSSAKDVI